MAIQIVLTVVTLLILVGGVLSARLVQERRRYAAARRRLEVDITTMSAGVHRRMREFEQAQKEKMLNDERNRIMRDVHDGLGGLLVQAIGLVEQGEQAPALRDVLSLALTDLRLIVDSLSPTDSRLASLIANFRHLHTRLHRNNSCVFQWQVDSIGKIEIGPTRALTVLRILQEALTNVSKHSQATHATVSIVHTASNTICVTVKDNGIGFHPTRSSGRGIASMRQRVESLSGHLAVSGSNDGVVVSFSFPLIPQSDDSNTKANQNHELNANEVIEFSSDIAAQSTSHLGITRSRSTGGSAASLAPAVRPVQGVSPQKAPRCES